MLVILGISPAVFPGFTEGPFDLLEGVLLLAVKPETRSRFGIFNKDAPILKC